MLQDCVKGNLGCCGNCARPAGARFSGVIDCIEAGAVGALDFLTGGTTVAPTAGIGIGAGAKCISDATKGSGAAAGAAITSQQGAAAQYQQDQQAALVAKQAADSQRNLVIGGLTLAGVLAAGVVAWKLSKRGKK